MGKMKGMNAKAAAALDKKADHEKVVSAKSAAEQEKQEQKEWSQGANNRGSKRAEDAATKADEAARKRQEKAALLAEEEANLGPSGKVKKAPTLSGKKGKKKNDLSLLEDALVGAADKKVKAKKKAEALKAEKLERERLKREKEEAEKVVDPLLANTEQMLAGTGDDLTGRAANKALEESNAAASGLDGALSSLNISTSAASGNQATSAKALFKAFEERMLPEMKADYPGLKLSQYKEKIFNLWKKSPENPANQMP